MREIALGLATTIGDHPLLTDLTFDWMEPARVVKVEVLQDKARQLGVTSEDIAGALNGIVGGVNITQVRDSIYLVDVLARARPSERQSVDTLLNLQLPGQSGQSVPLAAIATFSYEIEQPVVWRRSRIPTITLRAGILDDTQPATIVAATRARGRGLHRDAARRLHGRRSPARSRRAPRRRGRSRPSSRSCSS